MILPEILKAKSVRIHLGAWAVCVVFFGLVTLGMEEMLIGCAIAGMIAFLSAIVALPVSLIDLFQSKGKPLNIRLQFAAVAIMAAFVLACGVVFKVITAGRH